MTQELLYEGKAKIIYKTDEPHQLIQFFKDDATAFNGEKKDQLAGKGIINNYISEFIMHKMSDNNIPNHFIKRIDDRKQLIKKAEIIPLEVIVRNTASGSFSKRYGIGHGTDLPFTLIEFCLKDDALGDPFLNEDHIRILNIASDEEVQQIKEYTLKVNEVLIDIFKNANIKLVDFKIEFGRDAETNQVILADEISPDSCRLWDITTGEKMDKDRFRLDLGDVIGYYSEIAKRLNINLPKL